MGNFFGIRRRTPQITEQDRTLFQLKGLRDTIKIYQKRTEADLLKSKDLALKLYQNGMKDRALIVFKRKKNMEDVLVKLDTQFATLEQLVLDIETTQITASVVEGLKVGTAALKQLNSLMVIEDIERMMEDNAEAAAKQREISQILQQSSERYEDDELSKELENIIESQKPPAAKEEEKVEEIIHELPSPPTEPPEMQTVAEVTEADVVNSKLDDLPDVPTTPVKSAESERKRTLELAQ